MVSVPDFSGEPIHELIVRDVTITCPVCEKDYELDNVSDSDLEEWKAGHETVHTIAAELFETHYGRPE